MEASIEQLQQQLKDRIEALDTQRKEEAKRIEEEIAQRNTLADLERADRVADHQRREEEHRVRRQKEQEALEEQKREALRKEKEAETKANAAEEARKALESKLDWLKNEINKLEFVEEQHRKRMESAKAAPAVTDPQEGEAVNVEHPVAPDNKGNAVAGTEGATPDKPEMSHHLKHILRQAQRTY